MIVDPPRTRSEVPIALTLTAVFLLLVIVFSAVLVNPRRFDFAALYTGGLIVRQGNATKLYDLGQQARIQRQLLQREDVLIYFHPPFEALWFAALARLSFIKAYFLWGAINVFFWVCFQHLLRGHTPASGSFYRTLLLSSLFVPLGVALFQGQTSVPLLLLFTLTFVGLQRGRDFRAGVFLGLGLFRFAVVLPFAVICLLRGKWRLMAGFAAAASLLGVLSVMVVGGSGIRAYMNLLIDVVLHPDNLAYWPIQVWDMPTLRGLVATFLAGQHATVYASGLAMAFSASLVLFTVWRWRQNDRRQSGNSLGLMFASGLAVAEVTAPHLYTHDLTLMLLAVCLVVSSPQWSVRSEPRKVLIAALAILYTPPVYVLLPQWHATCLLAPVLAAFALATLSLARKAPSAGARVFP